MTQRSSFRAFAVAGSLVSMLACASSSESPQAGQDASALPERDVGVDVSIMVDASSLDAPAACPATAPTAATFCVPGAGLVCTYGSPVCPPGSSPRGATTFQCINGAWVDQTPMPQCEGPGPGDSGPDTVPPPDATTAPDGSSPVDGGPKDGSVDSEVSDASPYTCGAGPGTCATGTTCCLVCCGAPPRPDSGPRPNSYACLPVKEGGCPPPPP